MDINEFWGVIDAARSATTAAKPFDEALVDELAARGAEDVLGYQAHFDDLRQAVYRWDVWAAAYLVGGGCSDDGFMDFRAGLIAAGRHWYETVAADPDALADHPAVAGGEGAPSDADFFYEGVNYAASDALKRITGGGTEFQELWQRYRAQREAPLVVVDDMGEEFDFDDDEEMARRLPRLAARYL
ncbi:DUF4240 domain-containing protein [Streptomyces sp. LE64]|uniref:DUF4240 domain-containing protein n=1 Tax=Streptomyces sp. LE64 TaxID=3448653 RepID=UPI0040436308